MSNDENRRLILARRARFITATLAGLSVAIACGGSEEAEPKTCLRVAPDGGQVDGGEPQACLSIAADSGKDAEPQVCLSPQPPDAGDAGDGGDGGDGG